MEIRHSNGNIVELHPSIQSAHISPSPSQSKTHGGWKAVKFIIGNEAFEKLASVSLIANLTVYLTKKYNLSGVFLVNIVNMWMGASNLTAVFGAVVSDAFWGRFLTLVYGSFCALLGMSALTITAAVSRLRLPDCDDQSNCQPNKWQLAFLFFTLALVAIGSGGIKPCNIAFGSDQFDTKTEEGKAQLESFFNWWFFSFTVALVFALTGVVYIQTKISWVAGFAIPTACLAISITIFLMGRKTYVRVPPKGTVFSDMARVFVAAIRKRKVSLEHKNRLAFYDPKDDSADSRIMKIDRFKCLEKAAVIVNPNELDALGKPVNSWKLCSIQQVENMKAFVRVLPVCMAGLGCFLVLDQQGTYCPLQALQMDKLIGKFEIPVGWMGGVSMIALTVWIFIYEQIYIPFVTKITKKPSRLTIEQRIFIGIVMSILCMVVSGVVEMKRRSSALKSSKQLHLAYLLPQFILSGLAEAFSAIALMEFVILYLPESMRSVAGAIYFVNISIASYTSSIIINIINLVTRRGGKTSWLDGPDLNRNKLDYYYYVIGGVCGLDLIYFVFVARKFIVVPMVVPVERDDIEAETENPTVTQGTCARF